MDIKKLKDRLLSGGEITEDEAYALAELSDGDFETLLDAAAELTARFGSRRFDSCSIVNARSGRCGEDCKWCAQSNAYPTSTAIYPLVDRKSCMELADYNASRGIGRFSMVTSGRSVSGSALSTLCSYYRELHSRHPSMGLCASMGLLGHEALNELKEAGVTRYHCNLETAPSFFGSLCSTHDIEQKIETIRRAAEAGMEICSGGIIGMGESMRQRIELALTLRRVNPVSIPINVLQPIPGTPLEGMEPLTDRELLQTVAIFRLIHPKVVLRFAGGRARISPGAQREALRIGIDGAIMGDLLTTVGAQIDDDIRMVREAGYEF